MKKLLLTLLALTAMLRANAQSPSGSDYLQALPIPATTLYYDYAGAGTTMPKINWGLDLAWISESNLIQGRNYLNMGGKNNVGIVRLSFQPCYALNNGALSNDHMTDLNERIRILGLLGTTNKPQVYLNSDPKGLNDAEATVDKYYYTTKTSWGTTTKTFTAANWVNLMKATGQYVESKGYTVTSLAPFNEPDYSNWQQGSTTDMNNICSAAKNDSWFNGKRIMGPNTLNANKFSTWYNAIRNNITEVNTHMLSGTYSDYTGALNTMKSSGKVFTQDELHNVMEAMMGAEYGMTNGIWWGTAERARAAFCRASDGTGQRLGYVTNSTAFMAASVYRNVQDGAVQAFVGASERTAKESSFGFVSRDRDVYYNGVGPTRAFYQHMAADPNGTYASALQKHPEAVIDIQSGEDVQPFPAVGNFQFYNVGTSKVMTGNPDWTGWSANKVTLANGTGASSQNWTLTAAIDTLGGDFSYCTIHQANGQWWNYYLDDNEWSLEEANEMIVYPGGGMGAACEQWYLTYAGNGAFYVHNRFTNLCLDARNGNTVEQRSYAKGDANQLWKLIPTGVTPNTNTPAAPANLATTPLLAAVKLTWTASTAPDVLGYNILRTEKGRNDWNTIARNVVGTQYIDNTAVQGKQYSYKLKTVSTSINYSPATAAVDGQTTGEQGLVAHYEFDGSFRDKTANTMNGAGLGGTFSDDRKSGGKSLVLDGNSYVQLPYTIGTSDALTFAAWVYWDGGNSWQRIFDFGNGESDYLFLSPKGDRYITYEICVNGTKQTVTGTKAVTTGGWHHVAVTTTTGKTIIYIDGTANKTVTNITYKPSDVAGVCNFLGRSQFVSDPLFKGKLDDVRVYNYALSAAEISALMGSAAVSEVPVEWTVGGKYYFYNMEEGSFLAQGNDWGTQASLLDNGLLWTINQEQGTTLSLSRNGETNHLFAANNGAMYVDGNGAHYLHMTQDPQTGYTTISINPTDGTYGVAAYGETRVGWNGDLSHNTILPLMNPNSHCVPGTTWMLMEAATYNKYKATINAAHTARQAMWPVMRSAIASGISNEQTELYYNIAATAAQLNTAKTQLQQALLAAQASVKNPVDLSFKLTNPDLSSNTGWTGAGDWAENGSFNQNGEATVSRRFLEKWVNGWNGETLPNASLSQSVSGLPAGTYVLAVDGVFTNQSNEDEVTGAQLYATVAGQKTTGVCSTQTNSPACFFTAPFTVASGQSVTLGVELQNTTASWVAFDNFRLIYLGLGEYTLADITNVIDHLLHNTPATPFDAAADVDGTPGVTSNDIRKLVERIVGK